MDKQQMIKLPEGFEWHESNVEDNVEELETIHKFLDANYIEDTIWKLDCARDFLFWCLKRSKCVSVRINTTKAIVGFICYERVPIKEERIAFVNFLCVHKKLRSKRLTPVLISEITRRIKLEGINQAIYTSATSLSKPSFSCTYYHRYLRVENLMQTQFINPNGNVRVLSKLYNLPTRSLPLRRIQKEDCKMLAELLNGYTRDTPISITFSEEICESYFLGGVVQTWVLGGIGTPTDMISFYTLPITNKLLHTSVKAAYLWYYVSTTTTLPIFVQEALIIAKEQGFDVFSCLDIFRNEEFVAELKFKQGTGTLHYYSHIPIDNFSKNNMHIIPL